MSENESTGMFGGGLYQTMNCGGDDLTVAIIGDTHCGSTMGLCPPHVHLDDGGTYSQSPFQAKLWQCWLDYIEHVQLEAGGGKIIVVMNGDIIDGDHHNTSQIISRNLEIQSRCTLDALAPLTNIANVIYIVRGTEAHVGISAAQEEALARQLKAAPGPSSEYSHWHLKAHFGGVRFDIAHHGSLGRLPWTRGNSLNSLATRIELDYFRAGQKPPDFAFRAHNHQFADSGLNCAVRVISLPCWQGPTSYVQRISPGALPDLGGAIVHIKNGLASLRIVRYNDGGG